jgi:hypothetical protein
MTREPGSPSSSTTSAADCSREWATRGRAPRGQIGPRDEHQPCPASSAGRQATTAAATPAAGVPPDGSADDAFRTSVVYRGLVSFYPGYVETRLRKISVSSPVSFLNSGISAALEAAASGEDRERGLARLYYYK